MNYCFAVNRSFPVTKPIEKGGTTSIWIICQIGAREHYAIARALQTNCVLSCLMTDFWAEPGSCIARLPGTQRLKDRWHSDLAYATVFAPNARMLAFEIMQRLKRAGSWDKIMDRNTRFQDLTIRSLKTRLNLTGREDVRMTLFSYSYAALELFRFAKQQGWTTVLGQIDPGPEEERIVAEEHRRYANLPSDWNPAPSKYWDLWREELELADRIVVNSNWSRDCLTNVGVSREKMQVIPLVFRGAPNDNSELIGNACGASLKTCDSQLKTLHVLFLGQINLRKGIARLIDAMRLLKDAPIQLTLAGPTQVNPVMWADLPSVRWIGSIPRSDVAQHYRNADAFILPTLSDGFALTQLEALAYGVPVIASTHCGNVVRHGENGWILDDLEPTTIAACLRGLLKSRALSGSIFTPAFGLSDLANALIGGEA